MGYDLSVPNAAPGKCAKCGGSGKYCWGGTVNGKPVHSNTCWSCKGTGKQTSADIKRNEVYNKYKINRILSEML
jgi:DnaJ-class molecular chaperone